MIKEGRLYAGSTLFAIAAYIMCLYNHDKCVVEWA